MARRKTLPESVRAKVALAERLAALRLELFGDRGGPEMARRLGIPVRTWYNYEGGVTVPAEVVLKIIELTAVEAGWLLHGEEPKFRHTLMERRETGAAPTLSLGALLRTALQLVEKDESSWSRRDSQALGSDYHEDGRMPSERLSVGYSGKPGGRVDGLEMSDSHDDDTAPGLSQARREWHAAQRENRFVQVAGDAMAPILADGASVAFARDEEDVQTLDGKMVVTWVENQPLVRWFQNCGRFALLRAENPHTVPQQVLVDLDDTKQRPRFRRVVGFNSPH